MEETKHFSTGSSHPAVKKGSLRIYNMRFCPYAQRALLVAEAKQIQYDVVNIDLTDKPDWFLKLNPRGQVPTAEFENGDTLPESLLVSDFLDEKYTNNPLYPEDPLAKAKDRLLIERFNQAISAFYRIYFSATKEGKDLMSFIEQLENFDKELAKRGTKYFGGNTPKMLDYMVWPWFERMDLFPLFGGEDFDVFKGRLPNLKSWCNDMKNDRAVKKWYLKPEDHAHYLKSRESGKPDYDYLVKKASL